MGQHLQMKPTQLHVGPSNQNNRIYADRLHGVLNSSDKKMNVINSLKEIFCHLAHQKGYSKLEDFYSLSKKDIEPFKEVQILRNEFKGSIALALETIFPQHKWLSWKFEDNVHHGYWTDWQNGREFMDWLGNQLDFKDMHDWYNITKKQIRDNGGNGLIDRNNNSRSKLLSSIYSNHHWNKFNFSTLYWNYNESDKQYMDWLGNQLGFKRMDDWYNITYQSICNFGGKGLLSKYGNSPSKLLITVYPNHPWAIYKFQKVPLRYWEDPSTHKTFLDWLGSQLGFKEMEDWYNVTTEDIQERGGHGLLSKYDNSISTMIHSVYSQNHWMPWRFVNQRRYYLDPKQQIEFIHWLQDKLLIKNYDHWYRVSLSQISTYTSLQIFRKYPLESLLKKRYPQCVWNSSRIKIKVY